MHDLLHTPLQNTLLPVNNHIFSTELIFGDGFQGCMS